MATGEYPNQWGCPDLGEVRPEGMWNAFPGTDESFPDCPNYYRRTFVPPPGSLGHAIKDSTAVHLIRGVEHPAQRVTPLVAEFKNGALRISDLPPKPRELVMLYLHEQNKREEYEHEQRDQRRKQREAR